jgi:hypothetical protein
MKKVTALLLVVVILCGMCLMGCGKSGHNLDMVSSYMLDDNTVVVEFRNESNKTIKYVSGSLNLFSGSSTNQTPLKSPSFTWDGSCAKGETFEVTVNVSGAPKGLALEVNRIGFSIDSVR